MAPRRGRGSLLQTAPRAVRQMWPERRPRRASRVGLPLPKGRPVGARLARSVDVPPANLSPPGSMLRTDPSFPPRWSHRAAVFGRPERQDGAERERERPVQAKSIGSADAALHTHTTNWPRRRNLLTEEVNCCVLPQSHAAVTYGARRHRKWPRQCAVVSLLVLCGE